MRAFADDAVRYVRRFVVSFAGQLACFVALSLDVDKTRSGQNIWRGRGIGCIDNHQDCFYIAWVSEAAGALYLIPTASSTGYT
jgi:hypothetical protein